MLRVYVNGCAVSTGSCGFLRGNISQNASQMKVNKGVAVNV